MAPGACAGATPARFNANARSRTCSGAAYLAAHDGAQDGEEAGPPASSFGGRVGADRQSRCVSRSGPESRPCSSLSPGFPSDPESGCAKRRGARSSVPRIKLAAVWQDARRGARPRPHDVAAAPPRSLPEPVHEPAMTRPTAVPTVRTRSALRAALLRPTPGLRARLRSIAHRALRVHGACLDRGRGEVELVTTMGFPSDPEMPSRGAR